MKRALWIVLLLILFVVPPAGAAPGAPTVFLSPSTTYTEYFDTAGNWVNVSGSSLTAYGTKEYADAAHPEVTFHGEVSLREDLGTQDTFAKTRSGAYAWRLRNDTGSLWQAKVTTGGVGSFSVWVRRWDSDPDPSYIVEYSIDNSTNWTSVQTINNAWLGSSDWKLVSGTINTANGAGDSDDIIIRIRRTNGERLMVDDFEMTDYAGNAAPIVSTTAPAKDATNVAVGSDLEITFSKNVTVTGEWFQIDCPTSGMRAVADTAVSGGPKTFTINPTDDFAAKETCTVTVWAAQVADQDDAANSMATDHVWSFTTDTPPAVSNTTPGSGATGVALTANINITFSEPVTVSGAWYSISCTSSATHTAAVTGGPTAWALNPDTNFSANESCTVTIAATQVADQDAPLGNMATDYPWSFTISDGSCPVATVTPISTVQGLGTASLLDGTPVTIRGWVVGDFQGSTGLNGFYVQDAGDGNPLTSDGIFVYAPSAIDVAVGDAVQVAGTVDEYYGVTEISPVTNVTLCGTPLALNPTEVTLPEAVNNDLERYEGMLVTFPQTLTASQNYFQGRYGQVTLSSDGRMYNPTNGNGLGDTVALNARRILILDDGKSSQNPNPTPYIGAADTLRAGDTVTGLTGVIDYGLMTSDATTSDYRVQPTTSVSFTRANARTTAPAAVGGSIKVASFNVLNYFTTWGCGEDCRGASNATEFDRQRRKIIAALQAINADVVGLMEIENNGAAAVGDLVSGLNSAMGAGTYTYVAEPAPGTDAIKVAMIYKPGTVTPDGVAQNYQTTTASYNPLFDRPPLAQTFTTLSTGERFTVIVNHFKSKGSCPDSPVDVDYDYGQGCWNVKRTAQATGLLDFIADLEVIDPDVLVIGDLNAYGAEDPINTLVVGGLVNEVGKIAAAQRYSYVFDGQSGYLDQALATSSLSDQISGRTIWHINADEPLVIDYNTEFKAPLPDYPPDLYTPTPYRSSDHDPVIVGLDLQGETAVALSSFEAAAVPLSGWPAAAGLGALGIVLLAWRRRRSPAGWSDRKPERRLT